MLQDVIDLRSSGWVHRQKFSAPIESDADRKVRYDK